jgi:predicted DsbA family dithiol-disulfide isomerase
MTDNATVRVTVVSDTMCPWCYIGKRRLEKALALVPDVPVAVSWRPFQLDTTIPPDGMDRQTYLTRKFGAAGAERVYARIEEAGRQEGIPFAFDRIARSPNTIDSHRLLHWAEVADVQDAVAERLFALFFTKGADIGNRDVLAQAAADCGMDGRAVRARLDTDDAKSLIYRQIADVQEIGIDGVPCFVFNGSTYLPGAQPPDVIARAIASARAQASPRAASA